ncbi:hypothetical protein C8R46DRAFT_1236130 [Mycena filopes]|nr:hypothetical protein C8R46DRAFT_1236130 [Mycena filopes]
MAISRLRVSEHRPPPRRLSLSRVRERPHHPHPHPHLPPLSHPLPPRVQGHRRPPRRRSPRCGVDGLDLRPNLHLHRANDALPTLPSKGIDPTRRSLSPGPSPRTIANTIVIVDAYEPPHTLPHPRHGPSETRILAALAAAPATAPLASYPPPSRLPRLTHTGADAHPRTPPIVQNALWTHTSRRTLLLHRMGRAERSPSLPAPAPTPASHTPLTTSPPHTETSPPRAPPSCRMHRGRIRAAAHSSSCAWPKRDEGAGRTRARVSSAWRNPRPTHTAADAHPAHRAKCIATSAPPALLPAPAPASHTPQTPRKVPTSPTSSAPHTTHPHHRTQPTVRNAS